MSAWGLWILCRGELLIEAWLVSYDPDFVGPDLHGSVEVGEVIASYDVRHAKPFPSVQAALAEWNRVSTVLPVRPDGKPNKPLSAFTVMPRPIEIGDVQGS